MIPIGMKVKVDDLKAGSCRLVLQAVDSANNHASYRAVYSLMSKPEATANPLP